MQFRRHARLLLGGAHSRCPRRACLRRRFPWRVTCRSWLVGGSASSAVEENARVERPAPAHYCLRPWSRVLSREVGHDYWGLRTRLSGTWLQALVRYKLQGGPSCAARRCGRCPFARDERVLVAPCRGKVQAQGALVGNSPGVGLTVPALCQRHQPGLRCAWLVHGVAAAS